MTLCCMGIIMYSPCTHIPFGSLKQDLRSLLCIYVLAENCTLGKYICKPVFHDNTEEMHAYAKNFFIKSVIQFEYNYFQKYTILDSSDQSSYSIQER